MQPYIFLRSSPPIPAYAAIHAGRFGDHIMRQVRSGESSSGCDHTCGNCGARFVLQHRGKDLACVGTFVGFPVEGEIHTPEGTRHEVSLLVNVSQFAG